MPKSTIRKIAFISSFLPQKCGIATFTSDLIKNIKSIAGQGFEPLVTAMQAGQDIQYTDPVKFEIRRNVKNDYISAADYINFSHIDVVSIQHEFGLFGGNAGAHLGLLMRRINAPIITTLHTILEEPNQYYYRSMIDLCDLSHKLIVMNHRGIDMLQRIYDVPEKKIELIPHGIPDLPFVDSSYYKHKFGMDGRRTILTFGLLSRNKGIEMMLRAMPDIIRADPTVLYIILGMTHPSVLQHEGQAYRFSLQRIVKELNLQDHVIFHNQFVTDEKLHNFLCASDIYVTPYLNREQLTSGTLAYAVGTGKAVISTPYWAAEELLEDGRGKLVPFSDPRGLAKEIINVIDNENQFYTLRRKAYDYGRTKTWPIVAKSYWKIFNSKKLPVRVSVKSIPLAEEAISILELPEPPLDHLQRLTDDTGLYQHATFTIPNRDHGYCSDDNARGVVAMTKYYAQYAEPDALRLFDTYLSFICHAQRSDGTVKNLMSFERQWLRNEPVHDALGRTLWAFGTVMAKPPLPKYLSIIKDCFDRSVEHVPDLWARGKAYAIFGMNDYLKQFPGASDIKRHLAAAADDIVEQYENASYLDWQWFEEELTYDNAVLPHALYVAALATGEEKYLLIAEKSCKFLLDNTFTGEHFSFVGCKGWYPRGRKKAQFDQQPIEVASTVMMLRAAFDVTGDAAFLKLQRKAFDWFLGENDLRIPVYDFRTKGSFDGLEQSGVNLNQGAESMVSFLLSLLCIVESYNIGPEPEGQMAPFAEEKAPTNKADAIIIKDIVKKTKPDPTSAKKL